LALAILGPSKHYRDYQKYLKALAEALMTYCDALEHTQSKGPLRFTVPIAAKLSQIGTQNTYNLGLGHGNLTNS
jgi:hypothetical protein